MYIQSLNILQSHLLLLAVHNRIHFIIVMVRKIIFTWLKDTSTRILFLCILIKIIKCSPTQPTVRNVSFCVWRRIQSITFTAISYFISYEFLQLDDLSYNVDIYHMQKRNGWQNFNYKTQQSRSCGHFAEIDNMTQDRRWIS